jgi:phosphatidylglycerophosphatase A
MNVRVELLTCFGVGRLRPAPGTWGSLPGVGVAMLCVWLFDAGDADAQGAMYANITIALVGLAFAIACIRFGAEGEQHLGGKDAQSIVADEVAGQCIALLFLPWRSFEEDGGPGWNAMLAITAFVMFRAFDIAKPPPARGWQRMTGGWGILIDDVIAGVYALIATQLVARIALPYVW